MGDKFFDILMSCHHSGSCDNDCDNAADYFEVEDIQVANKYLIDCGIEDSTFEVENGEQVVKMYYLWMLSGDIQDINDVMQ